VHLHARRGRGRRAWIEEAEGEEGGGENIDNEGAEGGRSDLAEAILARSRGWGRYRRRR